MTKVAILQSNYIPWKGYFDIINQVDLFIFHDDLQYTKNDWRNRNQIQTSEGLRWLSIPCGTNEKRLINEVEIKDSKWQKKHWNLLYQHYKNAPFFNEYVEFFENFYIKKHWKNLSELNQYLIKYITQQILANKHTKFDNSECYNLTQSKGERVVELLKKVHATVYLSGPSAQNYLDTELFEENNISLQWVDYSKYKPYKQLHQPFVHTVSILDLIFNQGSNSNVFLTASD